MDIKWYVLGTLPPVGPIFGVPTTSLEPRVPPLAPSLLPSLTIDWAEVGHNGDQGICFGVPTTCGGKFWDAYHLCWAKGPSQLAPSHSPCSLLLPMVNVGRGMLYYVWGSPPPLWGARGERKQGEQDECYTRFQDHHHQWWKKLRWWHIVLMCPHHLEVQSPPNVHSHSCKRPS